MKVLRSLLVLAMAAAILPACTKRPNPANTSKSTVKMELNSVAGGSGLTLNSQWYQNEHGDSFKVTKFNYYISNIRLNGNDVSYTEAESYHLFQQSDASSSSFDLKDVPYGQYSSITFMIGVDSMRNVSGAQTGALDPVNGMFWTWSTGYIMVKFEGVSPKSAQPGNIVEYHAGGFTGANSTLRTVTLNLPTPITVGADGENHVHLTADILKLFKSPNVFDFAVTNSVMLPGDNGRKFADNYANMFTVSFAGL
ncbi:MAG: MbnP family protein [Bacteroidota bacterium]